MLKMSESIQFSLLFISALISALFYTGLDIWQFTTSYVSLIFILAITLKQRFSQPISLSINGISISAVLLLSWFGLSILLNPIQYLGLHNFFLIGSLVIVFIIFSLYDKQEKIWNNAWHLIMLAVFIWAIYGLIQYYYLRVPSNATFLNRNTLAALLNLALIPACGYYLLNTSNRSCNKINNAVLSIVLFTLFLTVFIITSRAGILSLLLGMAVFFFLLRTHRNKSHFLSLLKIATLAFLFSYISQLFITNLPSDIATRMVSLSNISEAGNPRFIIWKSLLPLFDEMPWYGIGLGSLYIFWAPHRPVNDGSAGFFAHNDYMQMTIESGYPGILLLAALFIFILIHLVRVIKKDDISLLHRIEIVSIFTTLLTYASHSFFTYNFYVFPLLIIVGVYLARFNYIVGLYSNTNITFPAFKTYFNPFTYFFSLTGIVIILSGYFITNALSNDYNAKANELMLKNDLQSSNDLFLKAQRLAPLLDNPFFSHANLLMISGNKLLNAGETEEAKTLFNIAHEKLNHAEKLNPKRHQIFHVRGLLIEKEQPEKAMAQFEKAISLNPRFLHSRVKLAYTLHQQGRLKEALKILNDGLFYRYFAGREVLNFLRLYADYSREAGDEKFALHLENEIQKIFSKNVK